MKRMSNETFSKIEKGAREALAIERSEAKPARVTQYDHMLNDFEYMEAAMDRDSEQNYEPNNTPKVVVWCLIACCVSVAFMILGWLL